MSSFPASGLDLVSARRGTAVYSGSRLDAPSASALRSAVVAAFPEYKLAEYFQERVGTFECADHIVLALDQGSQELAGIVVAAWREGDESLFLHVEMNLITTTYQRRGLLVTLWHAMLQRLVDDDRAFPRTFAIKTYNPMVFSSLSVMSRMTGCSLYPRLEANGQDHRLRGIATRVAERLCPDLVFDPGTGVIRSAGTPPGFYPSLPTTNKRDVYDYFARHLRPGDRLLCVVQFGEDADLSKLLRRFSVERPSDSGRKPDAAFLERDLLTTNGR